MTPFRDELSGWRYSFAKKVRKVGNWFNPDTTTGNFFVYGRKEAASGRRAEKLHSLRD
jgi:hypothetical protein